MGASLPTYLSALDALTTEYAVVTGALAASLEEGTLNDQELGFVVAAYAEIREKVRQLRRSLDEVDFLTFEGADNPLRKLELWAADQEIRTRLVRFSAALFDAITAASALLDGEPSLVITARDFDTLQGIAAREMGDWRSWEDILRANKDVLGTPGGSLSGKALVIPK